MLGSFDAILLARIQFAFTVSFHFLFPAFTIGLASYLAVLNGLWLWTKDHKYLDLFRYWVKIFALAFAMGVVSGIVMSYQFGTNWSVFSDRAGPVIGAPMAYEVLSAFFLEAGFLGIMLFGRERVGAGLHMVATAMVALGTFFSAFWILSVNSWMHTPAGFSIDPDTGQFLPENFWEIIFNPSFPYRLMHTVTAAYLTTAFIVGGVAAFHLLRRRRQREQPSEATKTMFSMAMWMAAIVAPTQIFLGDLHGLNTLEHQPAKVMAMEGHYESHPDGAPLYLFGIPNDETQTLDYAIGIPNLSSLILKHHWDAPLDGLDTIPDEDQPPVGIVFWSFRIMVALGFAMMGVGFWSLWARFRGRLFEAPWLHRAALAMSPSGLVAVLAGWVTTEVGRQPFTVYGLLRTSESAAPLDAAAVGASLVAFIVIYFAVFGAGTFYILRLMSQPPVFGEPKLAEVTKGPIRTAGITPAPEEAVRRPDAANPGEQTMPIVDGISFDLTSIWAFLIAFAVLVYVILDGFDLGLGMLFAAERKRGDRDVMMNSVAPVWDGNETWLVLGGGGLFAAFPLAYALVLPALYAPIIAMLLALIFRGVAFEFRWRTERWRGVWDVAFIGGSTMASLSQGIALGGLLQGINIDKAARAYSGGWWDWLTPFSLTVGVAVMVGYMLLGATWLVMKTSGDLQERMRRRAWFLGIATVGFIGLVSLWTPFLQEGYYSRWFSGWQIGLAILVGLAVLALAALMFRALHVHRHDYWPFVLALAMFALCFVGLGVSMFPYIIPTEVTIYEAAAPRRAQIFMLIGAGILIPIILAYTAYAYWVFRGKVDPEEGYH